MGKVRLKTVLKEAKAKVKNLAKQQKADTHEPKYWDDQISRAKEAVEIIENELNLWQ